MDIVIIGAGASGIICAIEASKNKNNNITIIESNNKILKKVLISGNGKCNFTNLNFQNKNEITKEEIKKYYNNDFFYKTFKQFSNIDLINYFNEMGMLESVFEKYNQKYIYPLTKNSKTIYYLLLDQLNKENINIRINEEVISFTNNNNKFYISTTKNKYTSDVLVISTGGLSYYNRNANNDLYKSIKNNNINFKNQLPALTPLIFNKKLFKNETKIRFEANVSLLIDDTNILSEYGEIQINNNSISGIPILNLSSIAVKELFNNRKVYLSINFLYYYIKQKYKNDNANLSFDNYCKNYLYDYFCYEINNNRNLTIKQLLSYILDTNLVDILLNNIKLDNNAKISHLNRTHINNLIKVLLNFKIEIIDYEKYNKAQLTQGGVDINELNNNTLEHKNIKNLYFTGEIIDVDGKCGGYNLQFAFSTGFVVGKELNDKN